MSIQMCDNRSVGVLIFDDCDRLLMLTRARPPAGVAPPAGHVDDHGSDVTAARTEVTEEVGLQVAGLELVTGGWRTNRCRRSGEPGHDWRVYQAVTVSGRLAPSLHETRGARWYTPTEVQRLADRTVAYAHDRVGDSEWRRDPGLEPVWCRWLLHTGLVDLHRLDEVAIDRIAAQPAALVS